MIYLLDANTLIDAKRDYYPISKVPEFWDWLIHHGDLGNIKIPKDIYKEFSDTKDSNGNKDELASWADQDCVKNALILQEEIDIDLVSRVTYGGYLANPTDEDLFRIGKDPLLISCAMIDIPNRCVVTTEGSKPNRIGANRHVPDVCAQFGIRSIHTFKMLSELGFSTDRASW